MSKQIKFAVISFCIIMFYGIISITGPDLIYKAGVKLRLNGQNFLALSLFNAYNSIKPDNPYVLVNIGITKENLGNLKDALIDYEKAVEVKPDYAMAHLDIGNIHWKFKDYDLALQSYKKALEIGDIPLKESYIYLNRASIYNELKEYNKALIDINKAIDLEPNDAKYYRIRALSKQGLKSYNEALQDFEKSLTIEPNARTYCHLAFLYLKKHDLNKAMELFRKAKETDSNYDNYYIFINDLIKSGTTINKTLIALTKLNDVAICVYFKENYDENLNTIEELIKKYPKSIIPKAYKVVLLYSHEYKIQAQLEAYELSKSNRNIEEYGSFASIIFYLSGLERYSNDDYEGTIQDMEISNKIKPSYLKRRYIRKAKKKLK